MWCDKFSSESCSECKRSLQKHKARGLCKSCYNRNRILSSLERYPLSQKWSTKYSKCISCKETKFRHQSHGLCKRCSSREDYRRKVNFKLPAKSGWSRRYEQCLGCKTKDIPYESKGLCRHCYSKYRYKNPKYLEYKKNYSKERSKKDLNYRIRGNLRSRLKAALKNNSKKGKTLSYLGCSIEELKEHLEKQFQSGMTWNNYGIYGWHIDHIIPLAKWDLTNEEEIKKACNYKNLQPLWAKDNWSKQAK